MNKEERVLGSYDLACTLITLFPFLLFVPPGFHRYASPARREASEDRGTSMICL